MTAATVPAGSTPGGDLARSTAAMTALTLVSRTTGVMRMVVVTGVLGTSFLGNTYQSANQVPNLIFELFAAGLFQAVLIPTMVESLTRGERDDAEHVARSVLGLAVVGLGLLAAVVAVAAPAVARFLFSEVPDPSTQAEMVDLGTIFLWIFIPQVVMYAGAMVATGVLNAQGRLALPVLAPAVNNVVVTLSYGAFWLLRDGADPSLDLTAAQIAVLAGGTTFGVVAFCAVPIVAAVRGGFSLRPRFDHRHPKVRRVARLGFWAAALVAGTQLLLLVVLRLANAVEGGVVAYFWAFTFFLLPHALFAVPVLTALFPTMSRHAALGDDADYGRVVASGVRAIAYLVLPATVAYLVLAGPVAEALLFGEAVDDAPLVARTLAALAPGLLGYGVFLFLARAFYARGDTRTPALVGSAVVLGGGVAMVVSSAVVGDAWRIPALAASHSAAYLVGAVVLLVLLRRMVPTMALAPVVRGVGLGVVTATLAGVVMWLVRQPFSLDGRPGALVVVGVAGVAGYGTYIGAQAVVGRVPPRAVAELLRGRGA